jgi:hypothetical protein
LVVELDSKAAAALECSTIEVLTLAARILHFWEHHPDLK